RIISGWGHQARNGDDWRYRIAVVAFAASERDLFRRIFRSRLFITMTSDTEAMIDFARIELDVAVLFAAHILRRGHGIIGLSLLLVAVAAFLKLLASDDVSHRVMATDAGQIWRRLMREVRRARGQRLVLFM